MEKEKNILNIIKENLKVNISMVKNGMEQDILIIILLYMK